MKSFKIAVCQMKVVDNKTSNIKKAVHMMREAAQNNADMVILPEMFNCPYDNEKFREYAENRDNSRTLQVVSAASRKFKLHLVAGSIPEADGESIYNSSFIFNSEGVLIGHHRKLHLFDIDIPGEISFKESETITSGDKITVLETVICKLGVAICYDIRFPELFRLMALKGVELMVIPGAFNLKTGPAHWEVLIRSRAVDNQFFVAAASPAQNENLSYIAYGHSMVVDPWGDIMVQAGTHEEIIYTEINLSRTAEVRKELPVFTNRRTDLYDVVEK
jgi:omega-amidase